MYRSAAEVWNGLAKNAGEGLASPRLIVPMTVILLGGQVLPLVLIIAAALASVLPGLGDPWAVDLAGCSWTLGAAILCLRA